MTENDIYQSEINITQLSNGEAEDMSVIMLLILARIRPNHPARLGVRLRALSR
jgi:hypothetical protein